LVFLFLTLMTLLNANSDQGLIVVDQGEDEDSYVENVDIDSSKDFSPTNKEVFIPTHEWQEIKEGQGIPAGLHVRVDMQTGKKEAKLLEKTDGDSKEVEDKKIKFKLPEEVQEDTESKHEALKKALKKIKEDYNPAKLEDGEIKTKFRSMDEIKKDLGDLNLGIKTDIELIKSLFDQFLSSKDEEETSYILEDLEYYVHKYDNAIDFLSLDGLSKIVLPSLNSTSKTVRKMASYLVGGAMQSNPTFQKASLEAGLIPILLRLTTLDPEPEVSTKSFYALSGLLRNFPDAQNAFLRQGGLDALSTIIGSTAREYQRLRIKILTLLDDLVVEREFKDNVQYNEIDLESRLRDAGWCSILEQNLVMPKQDRRSNRDDILSVVSEEFPIRTEHDTIEKVIGAMVRLHPTCQQEFSSSIPLQRKLSTLGSHYRELWEKERAQPEQEEGDQFFSKLVQMIDTLTSVNRTEL